MSLSDDIIGCDRCLGSWIKTKKVKEAVKKLKEDISAWTTQEYFKKIEGIIDKIFGDKLI